MSVFYGDSLDRGYGIGIGYLEFGGIVSLVEKSLKLLCLILVKILSECGHTSKHNCND